jgi:lipopolysaccharide transport system permease protein
VEGFRWSLLGGAPPSEFSYLSFALMAIIFITGLYYFKRVEKVMADIV